MRRFLVLIMLAVMVVFASTQTEAACTSAITNQAKRLMLEGYFQKADAYKMAFYTNTATWSSTTDSTWTSTSNEVSGTNYSAGGYALSPVTTNYSTTTSWWDFAGFATAGTCSGEACTTVTFTTASTCAVVYDTTSRAASCTASGTPWACCTGTGTGCTSVPVFVLSFTSIQPSAGTLTVTWPTADATNAIIRLGD